MTVCVKANGHERLNRVDYFNNLGSFVSRESISQMKRFQQDFRVPVMTLSLRLEGFSSGISTGFFKC